jgi:Zn-dependent peptidase ImmA (M78 family)/transcriptional regulator with XRE-family HTH domain
VNINLKSLGNKLQRYRNQLEYTLLEISNLTGISEKRLSDLENGNVRPSGDELLILSDLYKCDYKFFLSNEKLASFEQTETLYRMFGNDFSKEDRRAIQECLFLAECEAYLEHVLKKPKQDTFVFEKPNGEPKYYNKPAAQQLRSYLKYPNNQIFVDVYKDMRDIGIRIFRRKLKNSNVSGLYIKHPVAGKCVLINYEEDIYRQRFTAAHELAHTILDDNQDVLVSFLSKKNQEIETRANYFASYYLISREAMLDIPEYNLWSNQKTIEWVSKFKVSTQALAYALSSNKLIDDKNKKIILDSKVPKKDKQDPELDNLSPNSIIAKRELLERGLSDYYVQLCFQACRNKIISASRLCEMLLLETDEELSEFATIYRESYL